MLKLSVNTVFSLLHLCICVAASAGVWCGKNQIVAVEFISISRMDDSQEALRIPSKNLIKFLLIVFFNVFLNCQYKFTE